MYNSDASARVQHRHPSTSDDPERANTPSTSASIGLPSSLASSMSAYMFTQGKEKAEKALNIYSHIDYLRPYFDVEPKDVLNRLVYSLHPFKNPPNSNKLPTELYGPLMIIFTLSAILIYQMKMASHAIQDGTLIGTAFFVCFTYWIGASVLIASTSFICNSPISLFNYLSIIGYSLLSHCVVLFIGTFIHTSYDHFIFYMLWFVLSGAAGLKVAFIIYRNIPHPQYRIGLAVMAVFIHLAFLLYIHFAYHELAEEVSHALFDGPTDLPKMSDVIADPGVVKRSIQDVVQNSITETITTKSTGVSGGNKLSGNILTTKTSSTIL